MKLPAVAKRASWNLVEQMISSLTNSILSFMVARAVDPVGFGGFAVAFTVFTLAVGGARALSTSPLNIRFSDATPAEQQRAAAAATGLSLSIAAVVGLVTVVAGLLLGGSIGEALLVMGLVLPVVILLDSYRYVFFSRGVPNRAALNGIVFAVLQIGAVAGLLLVGVSTVGPYILVWGLAGVGAVSMAIRQSITWPSPRHALGWVREQNNLTRYTFASWATQQGTMQGALLVIAAIGTVVANGALRGAQILLGPAAIISSSALTFAIPEFSRRRRTMTDRQWLLAAAGVSGVVAFLALCWGSIFLLMPDAVGAFLLAETWPGTRELLVAAVVGQVLSCLTVGPVVMLYAIDRAKATFRIHLVLGTMVFLGGVGGVMLAGGPGAQWGFAIASGVVLPFWFVRLWRELRARAAAGGDDREPTDADLAVADPEATAVMSAHRRPHYYEDLESAQMATMVLPRITPRRSGPPPAGPPARSGPPPAHPGPPVSGRPMTGPRSGPGPAAAGMPGRPGPSGPVPGPARPVPGYFPRGGSGAAGVPPAPPSGPAPRPDVGDVAPGQATRQHPAVRPDDVDHPRGAETTAVPVTGPPPAPVPSVPQSPVSGWFDARTGAPVSPDAPTAPRRRPSPRPRPSTEPPTAATPAAATPTAAPPPSTAQQPPTRPEVTDPAAPGGRSSDDGPAEDAPPVDAPAGNTAAGNTAAGTEPASNQPAGNQPAGGPADGNPARAGTDPATNGRVPGARDRNGGVDAAEATTRVTPVGRERPRT